MQRSYPVENRTPYPPNPIHLRSLASTFNFETIDAACAQLQKSEFQLRTSTNAATWLEVCLLNLMGKSEPAAPEMRLSATSQSNRFDKLDKSPQDIKATAPAPAPDLEAT